MNQEFEAAVRMLQSQFAKLETDNSRLREENNRLLEENGRLKGGHDPRNSNQDKNEAARAYIAGLIGGIDVPPRMGYNLGHRWSKRTFQVQYSKVQGGNRWFWKRVFGLDGNAGYDQLILVGENSKTPIGASGGSAWQYVLFSIPKLEVRRLTNSQGDIALNVNPETAQTPEARLLYSKYQVTPEELRRYGRAASET